MFRFAMVSNGLSQSPISSLGLFAERDKTGHHVYQGRRNCLHLCDSSVLPTHLNMIIESTANAKVLLTGSRLNINQNVQNS